jgi:hypothetical protein
MTRRRIWWAIPLMAITLSLFALPTLAQSQTMVTGAGGGVYPVGTTFTAGSFSALTGVTLSGLTFGMGVALPGDGTANGSFESTSGSGKAGGPATYSGLCSVNPGDGTQTLNGVPFTVTMAKLPNGAWGVTLTLGTTGLPAAAVTSGSVTVK